MKLKKLAYGGVYDVVFLDDNEKEYCPVVALREGTAWLSKINVGKKKKKVVIAMCWFTDDITYDNFDKTIGSIENFTPTTEMMDWCEIDDFTAEMLANEAEVEIKDYT